MCKCVRNGGWKGEESTLGESEFVSLLLKFVVDDTPITSNVLFSVISFSKRHRQFQHPKMNKDAKYEENSTQKIAQSRCLKYDKTDIIIVCDAPVVGSLEPCLRIFVISIFPCFLFRWLCYGYHANDKRHWREKKARNTRREKNSDFFFASCIVFPRIATKVKARVAQCNVMTERKKSPPEIDSKQMKSHHDRGGIYLYIARTQQARIIIIVCFFFLSLALMNTHIGAYK